MLKGVPPLRPKAYQSQLINQDPIGMEPPDLSGSQIQLLWVFFESFEERVLIREIERNIVSAVILSRDNKILLGRFNDRSVFPGQWVIIGGGQEAGEELNETLKREVMEEAGIDIGQAEVSLIDDDKITQAEKTLEGGEKVLCKMRFYDHLVKLDRGSWDIKTVSKNDEFDQIEWFDLAKLKDMTLSEPTRKLLNKLGYLE